MEEEKELTRREKKMYKRFGEQAKKKIQELKEASENRNEERRRQKAIEAIITINNAMTIENEKGEEITTEQIQQLTLKEAIEILEGAVQEFEKIV